MIPQLLLPKIEADARKEEASRKPKPRTRPEEDMWGVYLGVGILVGLVLLALFFNLVGIEGTL